MGYLDEGLLYRSYKLHLTKHSIPLLPQPNIVNNKMSSLNKWFILFYWETRQFFIITFKLIFHPIEPNYFDYLCNYTLLDNLINWTRD